MKAKLQFRHGVHPPDHKELTAALAIRRMPFPDEVVLPLSQHTGAPSLPLVRVGDLVERGDKIADADGFISVPAHASAAGRVTDIGIWPHQDGSHRPAIRIAVDRHSAQVPRSRLVPDWHGLDGPGLIAAVKEAGVVGLGGAAFPTHVKITPSAEHPAEVLILNGCECEPYLTTDHRTMVEYPERVLLGTRIMMKCLGVERALVGVEQNKPDAIDALRGALPDDLDIEILPLRVRYPQGAEKMLIEAVLGREIPSGKLPLHVGVVVQNVASVAIIAEVFETGVPLIERIVTVSGNGIRRPGNLIVPVGTKLRDLIDFCGGFTEGAREVIAGGPMMGSAIGDLEAPVMKGTTGIVVLEEEETKPSRQYPCIRCGRCLDACPVFLNPQLLGSLALGRRYADLNDHHLADCMLCGCCSYVCPSHIPLSQLFRGARTWLARQRAAQQQAAGKETA